VVHWCTVWDEYLNLPVDRDEQGRRMGECPYCGELIWEEPGDLGFKGGQRPPVEEDDTTPKDGKR
jgi:hypothetical protein